MKPEKAIAILRMGEQARWRSGVTVEEEKEAVDMAIEALKERPHGKWKNRNGNTIYPFWERYECSECHSISGGGNFCNHCGADMRKKRR